jgi:hypothetical protein
MSVTISVAELKAAFIEERVADTDFDASLTIIIADMLEQAIDYIDDDDIVDAGDLDSRLKRPLMKQCAYEFKRRKDLGLMSVSFPDGSVQKKDFGEWLPEVEAALNRYRIFSIGERP